jgi:hypothetical protein
LAYPEGRSSKTNFNDFYCSQVLKDFQVSRVQILSTLLSHPLFLLTKILAIFDVCKYLPKYFQKNLLSQKGLQDLGSYLTLCYLQGFGFLCAIHHSVLTTATDSIILSHPLKPTKGGRKTFPNRHVCPLFSLEAKWGLESHVVLNHLA